MLSENQDLRVRRTHLHITQAFNDLLDEKGFQAITVQEIADRAMINRATFYSHFPDKYALFEHNMREAFREALNNNIPADFEYCSGNIEFLVGALCEFVNEVDGKCGATNTKGLPSFTEQVTGLLSETLSTWFKGSGKSDVMVDATVEAASWAMFGAARHWNQNGGDIPVQDYARQIAPAIDDILQRLTPKL